MTFNSVPDLEQTAPIEPPHLAPDSVLELYDTL